MEDILKMKLISSSIEYEKEEFYEEIEAPKFVDFRVPNHFSPDDRFWFCSRVGCDQKHEEELDPEAIDKNFLLRVMAARSPNVRFRREISRKPLSGSKKCPLSAPPKPAKSRLPMLALVSSSISKKLLNEENGKLRCPGAKVKPTSTPKARVKHVAAKYMTSPRKKKGSSPNHNAFRSVRNPVKTSVSLPKSKVVAKALVFNSPKKGLKKKTPEELGTPITKLCEGVKKLQINSYKKGIARKPYKEGTSERKKLPLDGSRKVLSSCKTKKQETDAKLSRSVRSKAKSSCRKQGNVSRLEAEKRKDDSSDMEIDEKSRCGSLELGAAAMKPRTGDQRCSSREEETSSSDRPLTSESSGGVSLNSRKTEMNAGQDSDGSKEKTTTIEAREVDEQQRESDDNTASDEENRNPVTETRDNDDKENEKSGLHIENKVLIEEISKQTQEPDVNDESKEKGISTSDIENQYPRVISKSEENEDKENALNHADNRNLNNENLSKHNASLKPKVQAKQTTQKMNKTAKENCQVGTGKQMLKNRKLKTTNPKPFRLRTDERGILKEATMERKANSTETSSIANENSQDTENEVTEKASKKVDSKSLKKDQARIIKSRYKNSNEVEPPLEKSSRTTKSPFLQNQREIASHLKSQKLCANGEKVKTMSRPKGAKQQGKEAEYSTNKASTAQKSAAQGKRTGTIPREPKFHSLHKPKSCIRIEP